MDTSSVGFQLFLAAVAAVLGALASNYLLPGRPSRSSYDFSGSTFQQVGQVSIGDTHLRVTQDNRVFISAAAAGAIAGPDDRREERRARKERDRLEKRLRQLERRSGPAAKKGGSDPLETAILVGIGILVAVSIVVWVYARHIEVITTVVRLCATVALAFVLGALVTVAARKVRLDRWLEVQITANAVLAGLAIFALNWLTDPPATSDRAGFQALLDSAGDVGPGDLFGRFGAGVVLGIFFQILGLALLLTSLVLVLAHTTVIYAIAGLAVRVRANPGHRPGWLRRRILARGHRPTKLWWLAVATSVASLVLVAGVLGRFAPRTDEVPIPAPSPISSSGTVASVPG
jgi:hypothetical protein